MVVLRGMIRDVSIMRTRVMLGTVAGIAAVAALTFCAYGLHLNVSTAGFLYLLAVLGSAIVGGFWEATIISVFAVNCLNFFFVPPTLSFRIGDSENFVALAVFEITALTVSRLSARLRAEQRMEKQQRLALEKLYELSRRILILDRTRDAGAQVVSLMREIFTLDSVAIFDAAAARVHSNDGCAAEIEALARDVYLRDRADEVLTPDTWQCALRLGVMPLGGIAFRGPGLTNASVDAIASLVALAMERSRSFEKESRAEAARHTEQLRAAVLDALAHGFKSPLTTIRIASSGLLESGRLSSEDRELAGLIDERASHLNRLTSQLLELARLDAGEVRIRRERVLVLDIVERIVEKYREQLNGHRVDMTSCTGDIDLYGDPELVRTAVEQFVDNAAKYSDPGTVVTISAEEKLGEVVISVHSRGPLVPAADRERIFERFYRTQDSRHRASGSGLGLSIARKIAEAHGGRTWAESDEQTGTTFYLAVSRGPRKREHERIARQSTGG
jgi:two-component system sensor histidine kinase KdpD